MDIGQKSIVERTYSCLEYFDNLIHALEVRGEGHENELSQLAVEDQIGRFRLWASNIGALQEGRSSLDYRLSDAKFIAENVKRLLDSLQSSIIGATNATAVGKEYQRSRKSSIPSDYETSSESSGSADSGVSGQNELAGYYLTITEIIGRLFKLSIAIRSPSVQNAAVRSASFVERDEDGNDISVLFEQYILKRIAHHYPDLPPRITERLSGAIGRRRRKFLYQRRHREKLGRARHRANNSGTAAQGVESDNLKPIGPHRPIVSPSGTHVIAELESTVFHRSILSTTTATQYVPPPEKLRVSSTKSFSTASGVYQGSEIDIPPPISPEKDQEFECPYCFFILSAEFKEQRTWRKHVFDDLEPYSCLFEDCATPEQTFAKYKEWVHHEDWSHNLQWCCDLASHDLQLFDSPNELEDHLRDKHNEDVKDVGIRQMIERNRRPALILWTECPFCKFIPDVGDIYKVSAGFSQEELASKKLIEHIGHHLQSVSTFALPWRDDLEDNAISDNVGSAEADNSEPSFDLDTFRAIETSENLGVEIKEDVTAYELDLHSVPSTEDQRWDIKPAGFKEVDMNDAIIRHIYRNQIASAQRSIEVPKFPEKPDEIVVWEPAQIVDEKVIATSISSKDLIAEVSTTKPASKRSNLRDIFRRPSKTQVTQQTPIQPVHVPKALAPDKMIQPQQVRDLAELIRMRYALDIEIWDRRDVGKYNRPVVEDKMRRSDAILQKIYRTIHAWDRPDAFGSRKDWAIFQDIKVRIRADGKRIWADHPPWDK